MEVEIDTLPAFMLRNTVISDNFDKFANTKPCALGIDEAGRGPVLGPMVYGGALIPLGKIDQLSKLGIKDSKVLNDAKRRDILKELTTNFTDVVAFAHCELSAQFITSHMLSLRCPYTLNDLSHQSAIALIRLTLDKNVNLKEVYVDTVGPKSTYQMLLEKTFPGLVFYVTEKADSIFTIVSSASILAKVHRDNYLNQHAFDEKFDVEPCREFGSGYPADPITQKYLVDNIDPIFGYSTLIRFSWKTTESALNKGCVSCLWKNPIPQENLFTFFQTRQANDPLEKCNFFKKAKIRNSVVF